MIRFLLLTFLWLIASAYSVNAQKNPFGIKPLNDTTLVEKNGFFLIPLIYYTPDTRWAFGGAGVYYFKTRG